MEISEANATSTKSQWFIFVFLFAVFALSSWTFPDPTNGYDSENVDTISEQAKTGSLCRQIGLTSLGVFALVYLVRKTRWRVRINGLLGIMFLFYIAWIVMSMIWTVDTWLTVKAVLRFILMCAGALAVAKTLSMRETVMLTLYICLLTLLTSLSCELYQGTFNPLDPSWRLSGVMHPISQGWNCSLLSLSALYLSRNTQKGSRIYYLSIFMIGLAFLILTKSRMDIFATILSISIFWLLVSTRYQRMAFIMVSIIVLCLAYFIVSDEIIKNITQIAAFGRGISGEESISTLTGRIPLWEECLNYASRSPFWGYGYNTFLSPRFLLNISGGAGWMSSPHSGYIGTLLELGLVGLVFLILTLGMAIKASIDMSRRNMDHIFSVCVLVWLTMNLILEAFLISSPFLTTFVVLILLTKISFTSEPII